MEEKKIDDGGPAFPVPLNCVGDSGGTGMSTRMWLAGMAMQGMLENPKRDYDFQGAAEDAFRFADAMIAESKK